MKSSLFFTLLLGLLVLVGCASVDTRISRNQTAFDAWPSDVQAKVRQEKVDLGFTPEQVEMALGEPSRIYSRKSEEGEAEIWAYYDLKPKFSIGLGVGSGGYRGAMGGVSTSSQYDRLEDATKIVFEQGEVFALESRVKN